MNINSAKEAIIYARAAISARADNARKLTVSAIVEAYNAQMFNAASNLLRYALSLGIITEHRRRNALETCTRFNCICPGGANIEDNGICWTYSYRDYGEPHSDADEKLEGDDEATVTQPQAVGEPDAIIGGAGLSSLPEESSASR